jgi:hypothetical protein
MDVFPVLIPPDAIYASAACTASLPRLTYAYACKEGRERTASIVFFYESEIKKLSQFNMRFKK